jgi:hypothetical protein
MTISTIDESQRKAARVVGLMYLLAMITAVLGVYSYSHSIVYDAAAAQKLVVHEGLLRLSIAFEVITCVADVVLIVALYVVLRPVSHGLALVAVAWRLIETSLLAGAALASFGVLQITSGADYLRIFDVDRLYALVRLSTGTHRVAFNVAFLFLGAGSTVFGYLWLQSRYIPRALAGWGVFSSLLFVPCTLGIMIAPSVAKVVTPGYMLPLGIFEVTMGVWLLLKRLQPPSAAITGS